MWNIIKALNYQIKHDNVTIYAFLIGIVMTAIGFIGSDLSSVDGSMYAASLGDVTPLALSYMMIALITRICGWDLTDKTINYEILTGHNKKSVYFSRVIVTFIWTFSMVAIVMALPVLIITAVKGWGPEMKLKLMVVRYLLILLPVFRLACGMIVVCFIIDNFAVSAVACFLIVQGEMMFHFMMEELACIHLKFQTSVSNIFRLMQFNSRMEFTDGKDILLYDASLSGKIITGTVVISLAAGAVYLITGYIIFARRDMK